MEPEEQVDQFNTEIAEQVEQITETVTQVEEGLQNDRELEEEIRQLNQNYQDLSRKRITFMTEKEGFTPTKPVRPLRQPSRKDHEGKRGLDALEPDLLEHKQHLDQKKDVRLMEAEHLYRRYRQEKGLEPVEQELDIPSALEELRGLKEGKEQKIHALRDYLKDLRQIDEGEKTLEETPYHLPEDDEIINDQIDRTAEKIYENWEKIKQKQETIEEAFKQLEQERDELEPIEVGIKYGLRPVESTYNGVERDINEIARDWDTLADTFIEHLPDHYDQRINDKTARV